MKWLIDFYDENPLAFWLLVTVAAIAALLAIMAWEESACPHGTVPMMDKLYRTVCIEGKRP